MLAILSAAALAVLAAGAPKVAYKADPARSTDVGTVELRLPRHPCFGVTRASVLLSVAKADGQRLWALTATVADSAAPMQIEGATAAGAPLKLLNGRNGDVACTDYQCPTGSAAVFDLGGTARQAASSPVSVQVAVSGGDRCALEVPLEPATVAALEAWAGGLKK